MASIAAMNYRGGYVHNPRGNIWLNDESRFGHKLLLKMGWSKGRGLGRNEDGIKENLKVRMKNNSAGVGWKNKSFFNVQSTEYDSLLKSITELCTPTDGASYLKSQTKQESGSLELRSQAFRNRLHYQRFVRGKDTSKYTEKDMKSIFILNKPSEENKEKEELHTENKTSDSSDNYNSKLNISEYFAQKKKDLIKRSSKNPNLQLSENFEKDNSSFNKAQPVKEKKKKDISVNELDFSNRLNEEPKLPKIKRSKEKQKTFLTVNELDVSNKLNEKETKLPEIKRSMEKQKTSLTVNELDNSNILNEEPKLPEIKKSKEKRKRSKDLSNSDVSSSKECRSSEASCDIKPKRKKKKIDSNYFIESKVSKENAASKKSIVEVNLSPSNSIEILSDCLPDNETCSSKKHKKSKKCKVNGLEALKSCLKRKRGKYSLKKVSFSDNVSHRIIECNNNSQSISESVTSAPSQPECIILDVENEADIANIKDDADVQEIEVVEQNICNQVQSNIVEEAKTEQKIDSKKKQVGCTLVNILNPKSSNYNSGVTSQRQANLDVKNKTEIASLKDDAGFQEIEVVGQKVHNQVKSNRVEETKTELKAYKEKQVGCSLANLPNPKSFYYNSWVESQRQALRMGIYKNMLENIEKDEILRTSNLLHIRGYGNWGYEL